MLKSLEILDKLVKLATRDFGPSIEELEKKGISINQIKQDLEVLEILRKYFPKNCYPLICDSKELEKWNKAKQWLLSNKVGDNHD